MTMTGHGWRVQKPTIRKTADVSMPSIPLRPGVSIRFASNGNTGERAGAYSLPPLTSNTSDGQFVAKPRPEQGRKPQFPGNRKPRPSSRMAGCLETRRRRRSSTIVGGTGNVERYWEAIVSDDLLDLLKVWFEGRRQT